jgi:hypothetical protein
MATTVSPVDSVEWHVLRKFMLGEEEKGSLKPQDIVG